MPKFIILIFAACYLFFVLSFFADAEGLHRFYVAVVIECITRSPQGDLPVSAPPSFRRCQPVQPPEHQNESV